MTDGNNKKGTIAIAGLGLIGASLSLALKPYYKIIAYDCDTATERYALNNGIADEIRHVRDFKGAECVIVCTPLAAVRQTAETVLETVGGSAVITDVGSVKSNLCGLGGRIVGGHPMAGTEHSGIAAAKPHLFENACYCVVPYENSREDDVRYVENLARLIKAKPLRLSAAEHDKLVADYSHMPHLAAYALSSAAIGDNTAVAGSGFTDTTRIACSDADFWTEVVRLNRENVLSSLDGFCAQIEKLRNLLKNEDYSALKAELASAQKKRKELTRPGGYDSDLTVSVDVKDEVGSIGAVVSLLMDQRVNIANLRIANSREGVGGALMLMFETRRDAACARQALKAAGYTIS